MYSLFSFLNSKNKKRCQKGFEHTTPSLQILKLLGNGDDVLIGGVTGNVFIDGGNDYDVERDGENFKVTDSDGNIDTLKNVEAIRFSDITPTLEADNSHLC